LRSVIVHARAGHVEHQPGRSFYGLRRQATDLAVEHPDATADDAFDGARELARLPCCAAAAADAYLLAFARGIADERVPEIAHQLELAGRQDQARRIRDLEASP